MSPTATLPQAPPLASPRAIALLVALLAATTILSQFFRSALAVIAPELIADLALSPRMLGLANGGFFLALLVAQVAVGVAFDSIGPRKTVAALAVLMTLGAGLHAVATDGATFVAARIICGFGCAASFMSAVVLISAWLPTHRWSTGLSWVFGISQLGILAAGAPLCSGQRGDRLAQCLPGDGGACGCCGASVLHFCTRPAARRRYGGAGGG